MPVGIQFNHSYIYFALRQVLQFVYTHTNQEMINHSICRYIYIPKYTGRQTVCNTDELVYIYLNSFHLLNPNQQLQLVDDRTSLAQKLIYASPNFFLVYLVLNLLEWHSQPTRLMHLSNSVFGVRFIVICIFMCT